MTTSEQKGKPSAIGFIVGAIIILIGIAGCAGLIGYGVTTSASTGQRFVVPGEQVIELETTGAYTIYHEFKSNIDGVAFDTAGKINGLSCEIYLEDDSRGIPVLPATTNSQYSYGAYEAESLYTFHVEQPGTYHIFTAYEEGVDGPPAVLALGRGPAKLVLSIMSALLVFFVTATGGGILILVTFMRRLAHSKSTTPPATQG